jgi:hypothetical protein
VMLFALVVLAVPSSNSFGSCCKQCQTQMNQCLTTCFGDPDCVSACYSEHNACGELCAPKEICPVINQ